MEEFGVWAGQLEIRQRGGASILSGRFPYGKIATIADRGRRRKERIEPGAFDFQLDRFAEVTKQIAAIQAEAVAEVAAEQRAANVGERLEELQEALERANVHILRGHDFGQPLGDMKRGTARVESTREAIEFEVDLPSDAGFADLLFRRNKRNPQWPGRWHITRFQDAADKRRSRCRGGYTGTGQP